MVENTISQATPIVKNTDDIRFLSIGSLPAVLSTDVARHFQRRHSHVLREIDPCVLSCRNHFVSPILG